MIALLPKMIAAPSQKTIASSHPQKAITSPHSQKAIASPPHQKLIALCVPIPSNGNFKI
ncbi:MULTISPECIES: hypothetical protein [unclassified Microcystis]|uniref:hypothetical protein n=2 Tax=Microcystis TaxID=1125 RepID=UPI0002622FAB|nr:MULTISPECIES: hypothetical protein [unclassified Microcystis]CCI31546.1 hypothetical protein MICAI_2010009 [Microcystis sp. T1-4]